ncbi:MAG: response regulator [Bacillota bacterium]
MFKVLIVDDEHLMRKALTLAISDIAGFQVVGEADNGEKAIKLHEELMPDIIFMDIRMPVINGLEASIRIKKRNPQTEIIFVTADEDFESAKKGINIGIRDYLLKPCSFDEIRSIMEDYMRAHMKKVALHDGLLQSTLNNRFEEACNMIEDLVRRLFSAYKGNSERYTGFKQLFLDLFGLIPCASKSFVSSFEKKFALSDAICNDPIQAEFWLFDVVDEVFRQRSMQTYQHFVKVFSYLEENINKDINMHLAARNANLSASYLSRIFNKEMGVSFCDYVNKKKIQKAKQLLKCSDIPVGDIAFNVGYNEPNYFCKVFRKFADSSPTQYRESLRAAE